MSVKPPVALGFPFEPVPQRARALRRARIINEQQLDLCAFIFGRADWGRLARRQSTPALTLAQLAEGIAWTKTDGGLGYHLRRLREVGLLSWVVQGRDLYVFTLYPDSESTESSSAAETQRSCVAQSSSQGADTTIDGARHSEDAASERSWHSEIRRLD